MDRHEPAPVCEPGVLDASRAIVADHLHKPPDAELGEEASAPCLVRHAIAADRVLPSVPAPSMRLEAVTRSAG